MTRPPHLLHVFPSFEAAGAQQRTVRMMRACGDRFRHSILALDGCLDALDLLPAELGVRSLPAPTQGRGPLAGMRAARALLRQEQPDLLLTYNWGSFDYVLAVRALANVPHVHHEDGFNIDEAGQLKLRRIWARRHGLRRADRVIVVSETLQSIARERWRLPPEQLTLIPNGIDVERFQPEVDSGGRARIRAELGLSEEDLVVGTVGHLRPVKNFARLIEAVHRMTPAQSAPVHLLLIGDGAQRDLLERAAEVTPPPGGKVHFAGYRDDLPELYSAMDVFALSSDSEQHPVSLLEAMACERAAAATDVGDVRRVLPEGQGELLVPLDRPDPAADLGAVLGALLADPTRRADLGRANRARARDMYSFETMLEAYLGVYGASLGL
jgi:L-malate glycosyltransferase